MYNTLQVTCWKAFYCYRCRLAQYSELKRLRRQCCKLQCPIFDAENVYKHFHLDIIIL